MEFVLEPGQERLRRPAQRQLHDGERVRAVEGRQVRHGLRRRRRSRERRRRRWRATWSSATRSPARSGDKGALYFPNNIMMYKNTPSQSGSEAFLTYYYQNMKTLWTQKTGIGLPPLKSIAATPEFADDPNNVKIIDDVAAHREDLGAPRAATRVFLNVTTGRRHAADDDVRADDPHRQDDCEGRARDAQSDARVRMMQQSPHPMRRRHLRASR